jgi:hypothetical protein
MSEGADRVKVLTHIESADPLGIALTSAIVVLREFVGDLLCGHLLGSGSQ